MKKITLLIFDEIVSCATKNYYEFLSGYVQFGEGMFGAGGSILELFGNFSF